MTLVSLVGPIAAASGVVMALSPLLQVRRIRALGESSEVSAGVFQTMRMNASIWLTYGLATANVVILVPNVCALATTTLTLATIKRFRDAAHGPHAAAPAVAAPAPPRGHAGRVRGGVVRAGALVRR
ncbi:MAG TPA: SemiSWEET family transporter [Conexibacter sp.]|nr:SemiSWEET family transporter [Conexibacter sp.]